MGGTEGREVQAGAGEEPVKEPGPVLHPLEPGFHQRGQLPEVAFGQVSQGPLEVRPDQLDWLINAYDGDIARTIRHASPPSYSQHTIASKAAIDFKNVDGSPSGYQPEDFKDTVEYAWLRRRGNEFNFYESWPEGNEFGMRAEPWHWQYRPGRGADEGVPAGVGR